LDAARAAAELVVVGTSRDEEGFAAGKVATRAAEAERVIALWSHPPSQINWARTGLTHLEFFCLAHGSLENSANYWGLYASEQIAGIATAKCRRSYSPRGPLRRRRRRRCFGSALFPRTRHS
jgi:hypothetical protein